MIRRSFAAVACLALLSGLPPAFAGATPIKKMEGTLLSVPLHAASDDQGSFDGTLRILRFGVQDGKLVASGLVTGTLVDESGIPTAFIRTVVLPVKTDPAARAAAAIAPAQLACDILHLELGPLDLDLLGLVVHLDQVVLDIDAVPGAGNLLGNLLCAITNLLNGGGLLTQVANLLNQLLDLLG